MVFLILLFDNAPPNVEASMASTNRIDQVAARDAWQEYWKLMTMT